MRNVSLVCTAAAAAASECSNLIASNSQSALQIFHDCGACVLQSGDGIYGETLAIPDLITIVQSMLQTDKFSSVPHTFRRLSQFSRIQPVLFPLQLSFPAHELYAMECSDSLDVEFCLLGEDAKTPCHPSNFHSIQLENGDLVFFDPFRASARFCTAQLDDAPIRPCIFDSMPEDQAKVLLRFRALAFQIPSPPQPPEDKAKLVVIGSNRDQDRLFELASAN